MSEEKGNQEPYPAEAKPSLYTFPEYGCLPCEEDSSGHPPNNNSNNEDNVKSKSFRNIHCVNLNCFNCVWDRSIPPVLTVAPDEIVTIECLDASGGQIDPNTSKSEDLCHFDLSKVNPIHGPIYIEGAMPGDTLEVEIVKLQTGSWGWTGIIPNFGLLSGGEDDELADVDLQKTPFLQIWKLDGTNGYTEMFEGNPNKPNIRIPIQPFCGEMGVAPAQDGPHSQVPPDDHGGNVDCKHLTQGAKVYFPVFAEGALFSIGGEC